MKRDGIELPRDPPQAAAIRTSLKGEAWCGPVPPAKLPLLAKNEVTARIKVQ